MTFTYNVASPTDVTRVRFHTGDTVEDSAKWSDEEITFVITESGSWQRAVIQLLQGLVAEMARTPNFRADWLSVDAAQALPALKELLAQKRRELDVASITATSQAVYRSDSLATEPPENW